MNEATPLPPSPVVYPEARPYWDAAGEGRLLIMRCNACGEAYHHPRPYCPFCISDDTVWIEASGKGVVYTFTVSARAPFFQVPAMVALDEGPVMMTAIVDCDPGSVSIGQRVTVGFAPTADGVPLPVFRPA